MSTATSGYDWFKVLSVKGCHRWFRDCRSGRVAVADDSGATPDLTDDGVLWLIEQQLVTFDSYGIPVVHLIDDTGRRVQLGGTNYDEAVKLRSAGLVRFSDRD